MRRISFDPLHKFRAVVEPKLFQAVYGQAKGLKIISPFRMINVGFHGLYAFKSRDFANKGHLKHYRPPQNLSAFSDEPPTIFIKM